MDPKANLHGIFLMVAAMGLFAVSDAFIKLASSTMSPPHTTLFLIAGGLIIFGTIAIVQKAPLRDPVAFHPVVLLRYVAEMVGVSGVVLALSRVPLSTVGAIMQAMPLLVVAGAALFLNEKVGWRRWVAIGVGFLGMLLIVQPGVEGFQLDVFWAVFAVLGLSARDILTRVTPPQIATSSLSTFTMLAALPFAVAWCAISEGQIVPDALNWWLVIAMSGFGSAGYFLLIVSVRMAEVSIVAPFRYTRLLFLLIIGIVLFGERPSPVMLLGATLILTAGIYAMLRERKQKTPLPAEG